MTDHSTFLFNPAEISTYLRQLPNLRSCIGDPRREGERSIAFAGARKTARQIYRVLASNHYSHLRNLLEDIDHSLARGFAQPVIPATRGSEAFDSALAELRVASHLLDRGFSVEALDLTKGAECVPEMVAQRDDLRLAVEVYAPRQWPGLARLSNDLAEQIKNADVPFDFRFSVDLSLLERIRPDGRLHYPDHAALSRALDRQTRQEIIEPLLGGLLHQLAMGSASTRERRAVPDLNLCVSLAVDAAHPAHGGLPDRHGVISSLPINGYAPEAMFRRLVSRRVRRKASRAQATRAALAPLSVLVVDLTHAEMTAELWDGFYGPCFRETLEETLAKPIGGYDLIAFTDSSQCPLNTRFIVSSNSVPTGFPRGAESIFFD